MAVSVPYPEGLTFPEAQLDTMDLPELRRYVKDLSRFRIDRALQPATVLVDADFPYQMDSTEHIIFTQATTTAAGKIVLLPHATDADAAVYTIKRASAFGTIGVHTPDSALIEGFAAIFLSAVSLRGAPYYTASFAFDGTDWWIVG